jgi:nucleotide-binding universal stress UspA family protein
MAVAQKILIPILDPAQAASSLRLAAALLPPAGKVVGLKVVCVPEEDSLSEGAKKAPTDRAAMDKLKEQFPEERIELRTLVRVSRNVSEGIVETVQNEGCDLLLLFWKGYASSQEQLFGVTIDKLLDHPPCNILVVRTPDIFDCRSILLPVRGGPHAEFALEVTSQLARVLNGKFTLLHCEPPGGESRYQDRPYLDFLRSLRFHPQIKRFLAVQADPEAAIMEEADRHDLVILGAGAQMDPQAFFLGTVVEHIAQQMQKPLIVVKTPRSLRLWKQHPPDPQKPLSERVDQWFAENSFRAREFAGISKLVELKQKQGLTVSLGLPALNEEETIGNIIRTIKSRLMDEFPLLDEIVLIDSDSTDDTVKIATDEGISVFKHPEVLSEYGSYRGKGEALWKSLHVLKGDLIVWIDTDIKNIHPGFVYGLVGPLLTEPKIQYIKGFYRRPIRIGEKFSASGGGRVTELTARPFLNLFYPELSGIVQPLAGEYGGRREILERVPFFTGYGVETGLLIDIYNLLGQRGIAQVDLGERIHRNQALPALSQMSFAIIQVFLQRLQETNRIELLEEVSRSMKLVKANRKAYSLEVREIGDLERPPIVTLPEYQAAHKTSLDSESATVP